MEDDFEELVLKQACASQMKFISRLAINTIGFFNKLPSNLSFLSFFMKFCIRPEVIFLLGTLIILICFYLQANLLDTSGFLKKISNTLRFKTKKVPFVISAAEKDSWDERHKRSAAFAIQGRRNKMEDRFVLEENINSSTDVSLFAIFDGHGGEYAAQFAKDILIQNLYNKIIETRNLIKNPRPESSNELNSLDKDDLNCGEKNAEETQTNVPLQRKLSTRKTMSKTDDDNANSIDSDILNKLKPQQKGYTMFNKQTAQSEPAPAPKSYEAKCYIKGKGIDFGKMITDEVLFADHKLVETARKNLNVAGTTALIALIEGTKLTVANVGDSRGVMYDSKGRTIPLSFDHKPQSAREHKRIQEAGGFIAFKGVWRVSGILATSRALGDFPLKENNLVIANPDILQFELSDHKPQFIVLASDGLWDTFTNEEATAFIKDHLDEPHFGAKSITLQSYIRGSVDNISTIVIVFKNGKYEIASATKD
ncbi:protein phosphatase 1L [Chironomus tepperi]|uniref:protein phosphatase 1L n=1 Tax=Chironomus tepperi TaxID=113505 RepID=UPI00391FBBA7